MKALSAMLWAAKRHQRTKLVLGASTTCFGQTSVPSELRVAHRCSQDAIFTMVRDIIGL